MLALLGSPMESVAGGRCVGPAGRAAWEGLHPAPQVQVAFLRSLQRPLISEVRLGFLEGPPTSPQALSLEQACQVSGLSGGIQSLSV